MLRVERSHPPVDRTQYLLSTPRPEMQRFGKRAPPAVVNRRIASTERRQLPCSAVDDPPECSTTLNDQTPPASGAH